jgi:hypothetical protein
MCNNVFDMSVMMTIDSGAGNISAADKYDLLYEDVQWLRQFNEVIITHHYHYHIITTITILLLLLLRTLTCIWY